MKDGSKSAGWVGHGLNVKVNKVTMLLFLRINIFNILCSSWPITKTINKVFNPVLYFGFCRQKRGLSPEDAEDDCPISKRIARLSLNASNSDQSLYPPMATIGVTMSDGSSNNGWVSYWIQGGNINSKRIWYI